LKLTTDGHEALHDLSATAELLFVFLKQFGLRWAAPFISSPIHTNTYCCNRDLHRAECLSV